MNESSHAKKAFQFKHLEQDCHHHLLHPQQLQVLVSSAGNGQIKTRQEAEFVGRSKIDLDPSWFGEANMILTVTFQCTHGTTIKAGLILECEVL
jgi:hypothetical protein